MRTLGFFKSSMKPKQIGLIMGCLVVIYIYNKYKYITDLVLRFLWLHGERFLLHYIVTFHPRAYLEPSCIIYELSIAILGRRKKNRLQLCSLCSFLPRPLNAAAGWLDPWRWRTVYVFLFSCSRSASSPLCTQFEDKITLSPKSQLMLIFRWSLPEVRGRQRGSREPGPRCLGGAPPAGSWPRKGCAGRTWPGFALNTRGTTTWRCWSVCRTGKRYVSGTGRRVFRWKRAGCACLTETQLMVALLASPLAANVTPVACNRLSN